jgi:23S rRNA pseudouridine2605 synthase
MSDDEGIRLQKVLAAAGIGSRRACEQLISEGRVEVNGTMVLEQGLRVDPEGDTIRVDGSRIPPPRRHVYLVLNKPKGVVSTLDDPEGRATLSDYLTGRRERLLIILTNDGDFAQRLAHPSHEVPKTYLVEVEGVPDARTLKRLRDGIRLDDGPVTFSRVKLVSSTADKALVTVTLHEGRNRIVRRTMDAIGHPVRKLSRTAIGPVRLGRLKSGELRELTREELGGLLDLTGQ